MAINRVSSAESRLRLVLTLFIGMLSAGIILSLGGVALAFALLQRSIVPIPQLLPADTQLYATLAPRLEALPHLGTLRKAFPELVDGQAGPSMERGMATLLGTDVARDIAPWAGGEAALALRGLPLDEFDQIRDLPDLLARPDGGQIALIIATRDLSQAQAFLDRQRADREAQGAAFQRIEAGGVTIYADTQREKSPTTAFALLRGYVVFASDADLIAAMAARPPGAPDSLGADPHFVAVQAALPAERLGYAYLPGPVAGALLQASGQELSNLEGACLCAQVLRTQADLAATMHGVGLSLTVHDAGLRLDLTTVLDHALIADENFATLTAPVAPVAATRANELSATARGAWSTRFPDDFDARYMQALDATPGGRAQLAPIEELLGIDLEADVLSWLSGEAVIAYFPADSQTALPFALRMRVTDPTAAERGLSNLFVGLADAYGLPDGPNPVQIGGATYQVVDSPDGRIAYSLRGDELTIAMGEPALAAMTDPGARLQDDAGYRAALAALPAQNGGVIYLQADDLRALLANFGDVGATVASRLAPFQALVAAGAPGTNPQGVARASLIFTLVDE